MADFGVLEFQRTLSCTPTRLYKVMTDPQMRRVWTSPSEEMQLEVDAFDLRPGGQEIARCGPKDAPEFHTITDFHVTTPEAFITSETLYIQGAPVSVSLCTSEILETEGGCTLNVTLQVSSLAGPELLEEYKAGWDPSLDTLVSLAQAS